MRRAVETAIEDWVANKSKTRFSCAALAARVRSTR